ncbi:hypothetical protein BKE38_09705 [Pseudoroseomonas deserti]|uniref:Uncharacterized protein n=2 Tax=Teichococcus deserti TaxID=1817963 RepID=A0A1V2H3H9_9PROT|nr:hypothetical protein BKE38_09705 [Pseudoroseomonas deserti]
MPVQPAASWTRPARTEFMARRYLASRGGAPMVEDPLRAALPRLRREVAQCRRLARLDLGLAAALVSVALTVIGTVWLAPLHGGILLVLVYLHLVPLLGLAVVVWGAIVMETSGPRLVTARRIAAALQDRAWLEALDLAVHGLPDPAAEAVAPGA